MSLPLDLLAEALGQAPPPAVAEGTLRERLRSALAKGEVLAGHAAVDKAPSNIGSVKDTATPAGEAAAARPMALGGCEGECELLGCYRDDPEYIVHHNVVLRVLEDPGLEGLCWLLDELESAGELDGPILCPELIGGVPGQHTFRRPVLV